MPAQPQNRRTCSQSRGEERINQLWRQQANSAQGLIVGYPDVKDQDPHRTYQNFLYRMWTSQDGAPKIYGEGPEALREKREEIRRCAKKLTLTLPHNELLTLKFLREHEKNWTDALKPLKIKIKKTQNKNRGWDGTYTPTPTENLISELNSLIKEVRIPDSKSDFGQTAYGNLLLFPNHYLSLDGSRSDDRKTDLNGCFFGTSETTKMIRSKRPLGFNHIILHGLCKDDRVTQACDFGTGQNWQAHLQEASQLLLPGGRLTIVPVDQACSTMNTQLHDTLNTHATRYGFSPVSHETWYDSLRDKSRPIFSLQKENSRREIENFLRPPLQRDWGTTDDRMAMTVS